MTSMDREKAAQTIVPNPANTAVIHCNTFLGLHGLLYAGQSLLLPDDPRNRNYQSWKLRAYPWSVQCCSQSST
jgi:hypothetical protein